MTSFIFATTFYRRSSSSWSICSTQRHSPISEAVGGPATADYVIVPWRDRLGTSMAMDQVALSTIQKSIWEGQLPLNITLAPSESRTYDQTDPYLISLPRISYLPSLLPRLKAFFSSSLIDPAASAPHDGWFSFEGVPLKWHYPVGLLYDLYAGADPATKSSEDEHSPTSEAGPLPWRLVVHFSDWPDEELVRLDAEGMVMNDAFINSVKEADFVRNGTAKGIMTLSKDDSSGLWEAVQDVDLPSFQRIMNILLPLNSHQPLRNLPVRLFLPLPPKPDSDSNSPFLKVVQSPIPPTISVTQSQQQMNQSTILSSSRISGSVSAGAAQPQTQTIGTALHSILPHLFPSRRTPVLAKPVLHGAAVPMSAPVEEVVRCAAYGDGWVYIVVRMMG